MKRLCRPRKGPTAGTRVQIPVSQIEYIEGGQTLWIHGPQGSTILRIKVGCIESDTCQDGMPSHADLTAMQNDLRFCLGDEADWEGRPSRRTPV